MARPDEGTPTHAATETPAGVEVGIEDAPEERTPLPTHSDAGEPPKRRGVTAWMRSGGMRSVAASVRSGVTSTVRKTLVRGQELARVGQQAAVARPRRAASVAVSVALVCALAPTAIRRSEGAPNPAPSASVATPAAPKVDASQAKAFQPPSALSGLDLHSIAIDDNGAVASAAAGRVARLTVDPKLQIALQRVLAKHKLPQAAVVMLDPATGKILAYVSRDDHGGTKDLNVDAFAPSASVFKVVTGAALIQIAGVSTDLKMCYSGGEQKITASDLKDDPKHDTYCATLAQAMGRSINTIFARLASRKLSGPDLHAIAAQLGYGTPIPFDVPVTASKIELPTDTLGFARTAAGFWNTTLSPLHAAVMAGTIANGGVMMRPFIVSEIIDGPNVIYKAPAPFTLRKAIEPATASSVEKMMLETVSQGTSYKAFHDAKGKSFLPGIEVAGKTGTLNSAQPVKLFTWFVGYAREAGKSAPKVAIAALVVNDPVWKVKANVVAREALQIYWSQQGTPLVSMPPLD